MTALEKGITRNGTGYSGKTWNILGQVYFPKAVTDSTFAFETNSDPGQFVPVHIHPTQDEFILVQDGMLDLKLDGVWVQAKAGDLVRLPRGIPHGYSNKSDKAWPRCRAGWQPVPRRRDARWHCGTCDTKCRSPSTASRSENCCRTSSDPRRTTRQSPSRSDRSHRRGRHERKCRARRA